MGRLGQQLIRDRTTLISTLIRAYADEWFAHYNYSFVAHTVAGPSAQGVAGVIRNKSQAALHHADRLAERISELGGRPIAKLTDLIHHATDKPFKLPDNVRDLDGALKAVLDAERTSIRTYRALSDDTRENDPVTHTLALDLLADAIRGEEHIERLLGEPAPEMDGR